uniref:Proteasome subunit beta n=1 Tax=Glossina austeni TaxID=7395 RepID=A0A1A9UHC2_GLOAU
MAFWGSSEIVDEPLYGIKQTEFQSYEYDGGAIVAIACNEFAIIAGDAYLSTISTIRTNNQNKLFQLSDNCILASTGCWSDVLAFTSLVEKQKAIYNQDRSNTLSIKDVTKMLSTLMYSKRSIPYYITSILAGLDDEGNGVVYSYEHKICCRKLIYKVAGSACDTIQPMLDNRIGLTSLQLETPWEISEDRAIEIISDAFMSVAEQDTLVGDTVLINTITIDGFATSILKLREFEPKEEEEFKPKELEEI